jgi:hypothetical protein
MNSGRRKGLRGKAIGKKSLGDIDVCGNIILI